VNHRVYATSQRQSDPAEGIRHAHGITRATSEFRDEPSEPHTYKWWYTDSPVGSITVTTSVRVLELYVREDGLAPFLEMELVVKADGATLDQPDLRRLRTAQGGIRPPRQLAHITGHGARNFRLRLIHSVRIKRTMQRSKEHCLETLSYLHVLHRFSKGASPRRYL
jgi:hypothetical protein